MSQFQFADDIAMDDIEGWCRKWRVKLNGEKSNLVILSRKRKKLDENLCILLFNDVVRPVSKAKFLGVEIDSTLRFKDHIQDLAQRAEKRLNILRILAWGGTDPKTLLRLYGVYVRSIFEYGSLSFIHCPDATLGILQKVQNKAIRVCLRLPRYVSVGLLHESACLPMIRERLCQLGARMVAKMRKSNPLIREIILKKEDYNLQTARWQSRITHRSHHSPLDIILPVKQPN